MVLPKSRSGSTRAWGELRGEKVKKSGHLHWYLQAPDSTDDESNKAQPEGILTIQNLLNARGVGDSTGTDPASTSPVEEQQPNEKKPDVDGDG